ncbi:hypothetical protein Micbo1qcDRAFT_168319, partial [Microdochium bolleyi]
MSRSASDPAQWARDLEDDTATDGDRASTESWTMVSKAADCKLINMKTREGWTALHLASHYGHVDVVQLLLSESHPVADALLPGAKSEPRALHIGSRKGRTAIVEAMLAGADRGHGNGGSRRDVANAVAVNDRGRMALHQAARQGHADIVRLLLAASTSTEVVGKD